MSNSTTSRSSASALAADPPTASTPARKSPGLAGALAGLPLTPLVKRLLRGVTVGSIQVELPNGRRLEVRGKAVGPHAAIVLHRWRPIARLLGKGDLGFAESYRDGDWSTPDLAALLEFGSRNEAGWGDAFEASWPARSASRSFHRMRANTLAGSRENISFHYDMGNDFYRRWLDPEMLYSSALYRTGNESLEQAQAVKIERILTLLGMKGDESVLEIGCGWGALAIAMAHRHRAHVTGLTLSTEQLAFAEQRVAGHWLEDKIDLRLQDYRDVQGSYDRIVSIEMLEAVGEQYWPVYFETLRQRLKPEGRAVLQVITIADEYYERYRDGTDFIQRFIFPGGMLPSVTVMKEHAARAGLTLSCDESFGASYASTLAEWRSRFMSAWPSIEALGYDMAFKRLWEYYLCYCEAGFRTGRVDVGLFTLEHADTDTDTDAHSLASVNNTSANN